MKNKAATKDYTSRQSTSETTVPTQTKQRKRTGPSEENTERQNCDNAGSVGMNIPVRAAYCQDFDILASSKQIDQGPEKPRCSDRKRKSSA
jgi:hypothetical protein